MLVLPQGHAMVDPGRPLGLEDLADMPLILPLPGTAYRDELDAVTRPLGITLLPGGGDRRPPAHRLAGLRGVRAGHPARHRHPLDPALPVPPGAHRRPAPAPGRAWPNGAGDCPLPPPGPSASSSTPWWPCPRAGPTASTWPAERPGRADAHLGVHRPDPGIGAVGTVQRGSTVPVGTVSVGSCRDPGAVRTVLSG